MNTRIDLEHRTATLRRGRMHYVAAGSGTPIVLLHGWPGLWFDYRDVIPGAARLGRIIAPDFLGFGESDPVPGGDPNGADEERYAADVLELLDSFEIDECVVVGHDIGSAVGPALARTAPQRVRGLVLLNPTHPFIGDKRYTPEAQREAWYQHFHLLPLAVELIDGDRTRVSSYLAHFHEHWSGERKIDPDDFAVVVDSYGRPGAFAASIEWYRSRARRRRSATTPPPILQPTVALWGDRDPMRPLDHRDGFERAFPSSHSRVLPGVGHFVAAEAPDAVVGAIAAVLPADEGAA